MIVLARGAELAAIDDWLGSPGGLERTCLVINGQAGIGKTTLWSEVTRRAGLRGWRVLACRPARSDAGLSHVGLADLLRSVGDDDFAVLPSPQRRSLLVALLREEAGDGDLDPRAVGTALTRLLGALADREPVLVAIDDAQWLDVASARAVAFALRRLDDRQVWLAAVTRTPGAGGALPPVGVLLGGQEVSRLGVGPLSVAAVHQLLAHNLGTSFPRPVLIRIHSAAQGNPFYCLEIGRELVRRGIPPPGQPLPVPADDREVALLRLRRLPRATRDVLAEVAAMSRPTADDLDIAALARAERAGLVSVGPDGRVEFSHPLFGSALYSSLPAAARRDLHGQLARRAASQEERARHLALAASGPDEATAAELDRACAAASARGAAEVAAELKELACKLTPAADRQALVRREIELADRRYFAGDPTGARERLRRLLASLSAGEERARVLLELGSVLWTQGEAGQGLAFMQDALDEAVGRELRAKIHSRISALADDVDLSVEHGEAALALIDEREDPMTYSFALHTAALFRLYAGRGADHEAIEKGIRLQQGASAWEMSTTPAFWSRNFDDFETARQRFGEMINVFRELGDEATVSAALTHLSLIESMTGHPARAKDLVEEALDLARQTEQETFLDMALRAEGMARAMTGDLDQARAVIDEVLRRLEDHPDVLLEGMARAVLGLAALAGGDLAEADRQLTRADEIAEFFHYREPASERFHADHAEAVIGLGDLERAEILVGRMEARAAALPRPWIMAVSARCRGQLNAARGDLDQALSDYQRALAAHEHLDMPAELGRTLLDLGRLHRRRNERQRARQWLEQALATFETAGALGWATVAADELRRASARRGSQERLTPTELKVCELAASGLRNAEIAARLFLSEKTVEANLTRAYRKLGVRSRTELAGRMTQGDRRSPAG